MSGTAIKFYTEGGKWTGTEYFRFGFTTQEVVDRCAVYARMNGTWVTGERPDGFSCGFHDGSGVFSMNVHEPDDEPKCTCDLGVVHGLNYPSVGECPYCGGQVV